jgi:hypothetical protein
VRDERKGGWNCRGVTGCDGVPFGEILPWLLGTGTASEADEDEDDDARDGTFSGAAEEGDSGWDVVLVGKVTSSHLPPLGSAING